MVFPRGENTGFSEKRSLAGFRDTNVWVKTPPGVPVAKDKTGLRAAFVGLLPLLIHFCLRTKGTKMSYKKTSALTVFFHLFLSCATGGLWLIYLIVRFLLDNRRGR